MLDLEIRKSFWDRAVTTAFLGKPNPNILNDPEYQAALPHIQSLYFQARHWHGTGRFQYGNSGVKDILKEIAVSNGLVPSTDFLDPVYGTMKSVSTSPSRTYASLYAQLHYEKGKRFRGLEATFVGWLYYVGLIVLSDLKSQRHLMSKQFHAVHKIGSRRFHDKYTKGSPKDREILLKGGLSDIPGNYPLLIGIRGGSFKETEIATILRKHESRYGDSILFPNFTHFEAPLKNARDVKDDLKEKGVEVEVIPIEWGEEYSKSLSVRVFRDGY